jgi:FkbM family methyltransferase
MVTQNYFTFPLYLPRICRLWSNWPEYLFNYLSRRSDVPAEYRMRNGIRLVDGRGGMAGTIAVVFVRQEYGEVDQFKTIVDIGANMGTFAVYAAQSNPDAHVYCYEPEPRNFRVLQNNIDINGLNDRVVAFQSAVASDNSQRNLAVGDSLLNSFHIVPTGATSQTVTCTTLKDIIATHGLDTIDLLKINCEGAEYEILEGCPENLDRIANIRLEYHNIRARNRDGESLARFLESRGFRIERFTRYMNSSGFIWAGRVVPPVSTLKQNLTACQG